MVIRDWLRDEGFYRDIATRAMSIALVGSVALVYGVLTGLVKNPATVAGVQVAATVLTVIGAYFTVKAAVESRPVRPFAIFFVISSAGLGWFWWARGLSVSDVVAWYWSWKFAAFMAISIPTGGLIVWCVVMVISRRNGKPPTAQE